MSTQKSPSPAPATADEKAPTVTVREEAGREVMTLGEHEVLLPESARTPADLLRCYSRSELDAYADCCSAGLEGNEKISAPDLAKFIWRCLRAGLDPFSGEVVGIWRFDHRVGRKVMAFQPEVRGYLAAARRSGRLVKADRPVFGPLMDFEFTLTKGKGRDKETFKVTRKVPEWCEVTVTCLDARGVPFDHTTQIFFEEFFNESNSIWHEKPRYMLAKRTLHHALLDALADLYSGENRSGGDEDFDEEEGEAPARKKDVVPVPRSTPREVPAGVKG